MRILFAAPHTLQGCAMLLILALSIHLSRRDAKRVRRALWRRNGMFSRMTAQLAARRGLI